MAGVRSEWVCNRDIQLAFLAARVRLSSTQVFILMQLVAAHVKAIASSSSSSSSRSANVSTTLGVVGSSSGASVASVASAAASSTTTTENRHYLGAANSVSHQHQQQQTQTTLKLSAAAGGGHGKKKHLHAAAEGGEVRITRSSSSSSSSSSGGGGAVGSKGYRRALRGGADVGGKRVALRRGKLHAESLRAYLIHLRQHKRSLASAAAAASSSSSSSMPSFSSSSSSSSSAAAALLDRDLLADIGGLDPPVAKGTTATSTSTSFSYKFLSDNQQQNLSSSYDVNLSGSGSVPGDAGADTRADAGYKRGLGNRADTGGGSGAGVGGARAELLNATTNTTIFNTSGLIPESDTPLPRELSRALHGRPHALSAEEINHSLKRHSIIPEASMLVEISRRVRRWMDDFGGRKDYLHLHRVELRKWQQANAAKQDWSTMNQFEKKPVLNRIREQLWNEKREALLSGERIHSSITRELYWRFDAHCRDSNYSKSCTWAEWFEWYCEEDEDIDRFKRDAVHRLRASASRALQRQSPTPPSSPDSKAKEEYYENQAKSLALAQGAKLQSSLIALRETALSMRARGSSPTLVRLEKRIRGELDVLGLQLPEGMKLLSEPSRRAVGVGVSAEPIRATTPRRSGGGVIREEGWGGRGRSLWNDNHHVPRTSRTSSFSSSSSSFSATLIPRRARSRSGSGSEGGEEGASKAAGLPNSGSNESDVHAAVQAEAELKKAARIADFAKWRGKKQIELSVRLEQEVTNRIQFKYITYIIYYVYLLIF